MENEITKFKVNIGGTDLEYEGTEKFLKSDMQKLLEIVKRSHNKEVKAELLRRFKDWSANRGPSSDCVDENKS